MYNLNVIAILAITGIGPVLNLKFSRPSFATIKWDPPPTAGVLSNLTYYLTVTMNTDVVIINTTTTETSYPLSSVQHCTLYRASVTAFSLEQKGDTTTIMGEISGSECDIYALSFVHVHAAYISLDYYKLMDLSPHVLISNNNVTSPVITVFFDVVLQVIMV